MKSKLKTAFWFLSNPKYISQIFQVIKRKKNKKLENTSKESTHWCEQNAISQKEALLQLTDSENIIDIHVMFSKEFKKAKEIADKCPVKMGGEGATTLLYHLIKKLSPKNCIETGVAYGWSSLAILLAIKENEGTKLISNDMPYIKMNNDDYVGCVVPEELYDHWDLQRMPDIKGIPLALSKMKSKVDFFHYDSDKSYTGREWSSPIIWDSLIDGGYFVSDDINDNLSFKHFCEKIGRDPIIIEHQNKYVGILKK